MQGSTSTLVTCACSLHQKSITNTSPAPTAPTLPLIAPRISIGVFWYVSSANEHYLVTDLPSRLRDASVILSLDSFQLRPQNASSFASAVAHDDLAVHHNSHGLIYCRRRSTSAALSRRPTHARRLVRPYRSNQEETDTEGPRRGHLQRCHERGEETASTYRGEVSTTTRVSCAETWWTHRTGVGFEGGRKGRRRLIDPQACRKSDMQTQKQRQ